MASAGVLLAIAAALFRVAEMRAVVRRANEAAAGLATEIEHRTESWEEVEDLDGAEPTPLVVLLEDAGRRIDAGEFREAPAESARLLARVGAALRSVDRLDPALARLEQADRGLRVQLASPPSFAARTLIGVRRPDPRLPGTIAEERARIRLAQKDGLGALAFALASLDAGRENVRTGTGSGVPQALVLVAEVLIGLGDDSGAEVFLREALHPSHLSEGMTDSIRSYALAQLGELVEVRGAIEESIRLRREALEAIRAVAPESDPRVARRMYELSTSLDGLGPRYREEAISLGARALAERRASACGDLPRIATHLNNLGLMLKRANRLCEAEPLLLEALAMEQRMGGDGPGTATIMNNIGALRGELGDREGARTMLSRSLEIRRRAYPDGHRDVAQSLLNLAWLHRQAHELAESVDLDREAVAVLERVTSGDDPDLAIALDELSMSLLDSKRHAEAEPLTRRALAMEQRLRKGPDPETAQTLDNLGVLLYHMGRVQESEPYLSAALEMRRVLVSEGDPETSEVLRHLAWLHEKSRDFDRAEREYREAIAIHRRLGSAPREFLEISNDLADCLRRAGDPAAAMELYRDHATLAVGNLPECAWILADASEGLAHSATDVNDPAGVEELLIAAARGALQTPRMPLHARARTVHALCDWYTNGDASRRSKEQSLAEARAWLERLDEADRR